MQAARRQSPPPAAAKAATKAKSSSPAAAAREARESSAPKVAAGAGANAAKAFANSLAESAAEKTPWKKECILADLQRAATLDNVAEAKRLNLKDTENIFDKLGDKSAVPLRRTFEAACLLLGVAGVANSDRWCTDTSSPEIASSWTRQKMKKIIGDASLKERLGEFVKREEEMREQPGLATFVANTYFREETRRAGGFEMLTHDRVLKSNELIGKSKGEALPAVIMFNWCVAMLAPELQTIVDELIKEEEEEVASKKEEEEKEAKRIKDEENAKRKISEDAKRKEEEEARRKAEAETKAKAEAEAARKAAEEEARRKEEEEMRKKEAEAKEKAELEARLRAQAAAEEAEKAKCPDRCFEIYVAFPAGSDALSSDQEEPLQTVAATSCMRQSLSLQITPCVPPDGLAMAEARMNAVRKFLVDNGVPPSAISSGEAQKTNDSTQGITCRFLLSCDTQLIAHFRSGAKRASEPDVQDIVEWLQDSFKTVML